MESLSVEEENYVRMSLLLTGISPRAVRTFFDSEFPPACLEATMKKEYNKLFDLKKKHRIHQSQWNLLFPRSPAVPDSKTFDMTLMITLLRNLTPLNPPLVGFDRLPSAMETSPASDLARIKYYRSFLAHLDYGKLYTTYMTTAWTDMIGAICRLGGTQMKLECDHLKTKPLDQTNQDVMMDIKRSNDEIRVLKESQYLQEDHRKVTKEMEILESTLSEKEENYVRMSFLLTGISPRAVRTFFDSAFAPAYLEWTIKKEYNKLFELKKRHRINQSQWNLLFPRLPDVPDSKTFDLTLMILLLQFLTPLTPPLYGFDRLPSDMEITPAADLARIKHYRNYLAHLDEGKLDIGSFNTAWNDITCAIHRLGGTQMKLECDHLKTKSLDQTNQEVIKQSNDEIKLLKESYKLLQEDHRKVTKEMEILKSTLNDTVPWNIRGMNGDIHSNSTPCPAAPDTGQIQELEEERKILQQQLSNMPEPAVSEVESRSALIQLAPPEYDQSEFEIDPGEFRYELLLSDKGKEGKYKLVYSGDATEITLKDLKPATDYFLRVCTSLEEVKGKPTKAVQFTTGTCEPDAPVPPKLSSTTKTSITLKWKATCENGSKVTTYMLDYDKGLGDGFVEVYNGLQRHHRVSKLQASTKYMFRVAAINNVGKSQYSEPVAFYTCGSVPNLPDVGMYKYPATSTYERIPTEIRNMEQRSIDIYLSALQFGSEKKKNINLKIVGKKGAGKTSLVCRLFGEEFTKVDSTNGIDIHRRKFKIKSDPWTKMEERDKESEFRIRLKKSFVQKLLMNNKDQSTPEFSPGILQKQNPNIAETLHKDEILYERIEGNDNFIDERVEDKDDVITGKIKQIRKDIDVPVQVLKQGSNQPPKAVPQNSKEIVTEFLAISNEVLKDEEDYTTLTLWDFAGDEEFYATHQTFLNPDAVYLVVVNLNDKDEENEKNKHVTFKFWMDTIHCYGIRTDAIHVDHTKKMPLFDPPVIFVGTHTDELENADCSEIISSYMDKLRKDPMQHLRQSYQVSNTKYGNGQFHDIREYIFDLAINSKNYERQYPVKLIRLERVLHDEYKSGRRILSYSEVRDLASKISDFPITDEEELNLFLRYQHEIGYLVFFHDIPEYIILDPQWLIDAFKCIVTVTKFQKKLLVPYFEMWQEVKKTGKISYQLIKAIFCSQQNNFMDHQDHLLAVMEKFDIIINPLVQTIKSHVNSNEETYFYIPWMMKVKETEVDKFFRVKNEFKSTCLCFNFNFLPPYLISHLIVSCIRKYSVASVHKQEGLFKDCCVFDISDNGCTKLLLIKYDNLIQLQIWQWDKDQPCQYKEIFNFIKGELKRIVDIRYRMTTVSFNEKWKCSLTSYSYNCESSLNIFGEMRDGDNFYCGEHGEDHQYKDDWFGETSKATGILNDQQHNFARLSMVVLDILGSVLYDRFDLDKNIGQILHSRDQYDISSLYQEHYKLRKHTPSKGRWGGGRIADDVLPSHTCIGDDIERIRLIRNEMQHSGTFALDDARYHILITIIQDMLNRFDHHNNPAGDSYVNRLKEIRKMELTPKDFEDMKAQIQKESSTPHQNFADKIEYHYHF